MSNKFHYVISLKYTDKAGEACMASFYFMHNLARIFDSGSLIMADESILFRAAPSLYHSFQNVASASPFMIMAIFHLISVQNKIFDHAWLLYPGNNNII